MGGQLQIAAPPPRPPDLGWPAIRARNAALAITPETNACQWDGDPVQYGYVIDSLLYLDG